MDVFTAEPGCGNGADQHPVKDPRGQIPDLGVFGLFDLGGRAHGDPS